MTARWLAGLILAGVLHAGPAAGQPLAPQPERVMAAPFVDPVNGLSLSEAIDLALAREPSLAARRTRVDAMRGAQQQAGLRPNPTLGFEQRLEPGGTDRVTTLGLEWPLDLFRRSARVDLAEAELSAVVQSVADDERKLAAEVRARFGDVLVAVRDLEVLDGLLGTIRAQRDLLAARVEEGAAPPLDRDLIDVEVRRLEADRHLQRGAAEAAVVELKRLLGMPADAPLAVRERLEGLTELEALATPPTETIRPDLREAEARLEAADAAIQRARNDGRFDMSVYGTYMRMDAGFPQQAFGPDGGLERVRGLFHYVVGGVRLTLPIRNRNQGATAAADAAREGARASLDAVRLSVATEVASATARDERARDATRVYREGLLTLARQNLAVVRQSYELGRLTLLDVLAEQRRLLDVERDYSAAMRASYEARTALLLAKGMVP